jgi:hypothetical protein
MAREKIKVRKPVIDAGTQPGDIPVIRGDTNIKPPTKADIQRMKNQEFMRKKPFTNA